MLVTAEEAQLTRRCLAGDQAAYQAVYAAQAGTVMAYLLRSGFAHSDAEDLTQETFTRAFAALDTFDARRGTLRGWLAAIARNVARKHWGRRKDPESFDPQLADEVFAAADNPGQRAEAREQTRAVRECVENLPGELARIVRLRYVDGRTTRGVAEAADIPEATVRLRLGQARELLAKCLREKGLVQ